MRPSAPFDAADCVEQIEEMLMLLGLYSLLDQRQRDVLRDYRNALNRISAGERSIASGRKLIERLRARQIDA